MRLRGKLYILLVFLITGVFCGLLVGEAEAGTYSYCGGEIQIITDPASQAGTIRFSSYPISAHKPISSIKSSSITVTYIGGGGGGSLNGLSVSTGGSGFLINGDAPILPDATGYQVNFSVSYTYTEKYFDNTVGHTKTRTVNAQTNCSSPALTVTAEMWNRPPTISLSPEIINNTVFSEVTGYNQLAVSGTVADEDNDNVIVTASLNGTNNSAVIERCQGGKPFSFFFTIDGSKPEGMYTIDLWADDGR